MAFNMLQMNSRCEYAPVEFEDVRAFDRFLVQGLDHSVQTSVRQPDIALGDGCAAFSVHR